MKVSDMVPYTFSLVSSSICNVMSSVTTSFEPGIRVRRAPLRDPCVLELPLGDRLAADVGHRDGTVRTEVGLAVDDLLRPFPELLVRGHVALQRDLAVLRLAWPLRGHGVAQYARGDHSVTSTSTDNPPASLKSPSMPLSSADGEPRADDQRVGYRVLEVFLPCRYLPIDPSDQTDVVLESGRCGR